MRKHIISTLNKYNVNHIYKQTFYIIHSSRISMSLDGKTRTLFTDQCYCYCNCANKQVQVTMYIKYNILLITVASCSLRQLILHKKTFSPF